MSNWGKFVWHELLTTDLAASRTFYQKLFPWRFDDVDLGPAGSYTRLALGGRSVGRMVPLEKSRGLPSSWVAYVSVEDVDATVAEASKLGGKPCLAPTELPGVGRFARIEDPSGAILSPLQPSNAGVAVEDDDAPSPHGDFVWDELLTDAPDEAARFYQGLFGYRTAVRDLGTLGKYTVFQRRDGAIDAAGMLRSPANAQRRPFWLPYVQVEAVDPYADRAAVLGAKLYVPPSDIPGIGRFSVLADPTGATLAVFTPNG